MKAHSSIAFETDENCSTVQNVWPWVTTGGLVPAVHLQMTALLQELTAIRIGGRHTGELVA